MSHVRVCGANCHGAKGPKCRCWCGGKFHGEAGKKNREDWSMIMLKEFNITGLNAKYKPGMVQGEIFETHPS